MTMTAFLADIIEVLDAVAPDWAGWVGFAVAIGAAIRIGPRLYKKFF